MMFGGLFGPPPTPEEIRAAQLANLKSRSRMEGIAKEALPIIKRMRADAHELVRLGAGEGPMVDVRRNLAVIYDDLQAMLEVPPPPDTSG